MNSASNPIQSLDIVNEQILAFVFPSAESADNQNPSKQSTYYKRAYHLGYEAKNGEATARQNEAIKTTLGLMRNLLLDAQGKFRKMVEENKALAGKLDGDLQSAHRQMALIRAELCDTNKRISQLSSGSASQSNNGGSNNHHHSHLPHQELPSSTAPLPSSNNTTNNGATTSANTNNAAAASSSSSSGSSSSSNPSSTNGLLEERNSTQLNGVISNNGHDDSDDSSDSLDLGSLSLTEVRQEYEKMLGQNRTLKRTIKELRKARDSQDPDGKSQDILTELQHAKEALSALKGDRKRLKAEKFELLSQMKQLYATLEDKEKELRDFIRNYEQRMRESESSLQRLAIERDEAERERWSILRHARDEAERGLALATQLNLREAQIQQLQQELHETKRQLAQYGIYSETDRSTSTNAASHYSLVSNLTATYATVGDRGSSADSGVRLSSDRDSAGGLPTTGNLSDSANEAISLDLCGDGSGDGDSMSVISTATLPQLFATPRDSPGPLSFSSLARSLETNALSRSAEQLLAVEAAEVRRKNSRRNDLTGRASTGAKGAWGSISRVFARNKHRRTLDPTLYDGAGSAAGQRTSWSPQSSVSQSPLAEQDSYADKLRALEEAATLPMELWRAGMVQAWIEVSLGMPQYGSRCADNIKSGKVLLELSDSELESELGITHPLHRKKLRLAIEEHRNPALVRFPCIAELSHVWVSSEWLPDIGLPQYAEHFAGCLVDARLLDHLSKKDLEKYLGVTRKFHMASIAHGVHLLRMVGYDRQALAERRRHCESDPLVWTNQHFVQWARSIDLTEYAENLKGSGVHGAICVLEPSFNGDTLASAMGIPPSKQIIRRHLSTELDGLLTPARAKITQQYRMTKSRMSTLEKQRSDSLGRSAVLSSEPFRRSTEDNRRRTSLRGSLSRALGLKIKQDLHNRRENEKRKSEDRDSTPVATPSSVHGHMNNSFIPPPLPPGRPPPTTRFGSGRTIGGGGGGGGSTEESSIASSIGGHQDKMALYARPQSALNFRTSLNSNASKEREKVEDDADEESVGLTSDNTTSGGESSSRDLSEEIKAHRRATSISSDAQEHVAIHTPV
ncbi:unnamed protein product [Orchesella dallaii]|uniref:SAM domain-containing protein n=2 Tax=Orchesella dallaii TaxID=48710 RepID=A0ABP1S959_9HEXA